VKFEIPPLAYAEDALEPHLGAETLELHYAKRDEGYLEKLRKSTEGTPRADRTLSEIVRASAASLFNRAFGSGWDETEPGTRSGASAGDAG
jgi:Fe-Mn family superoxide dismutase